MIDFAFKAKKVIENLTDSFEIVLVGNYLENSEDKTREYIDVITKQDSCFTSVCKPKKGMMGWDMKEGLYHAKGKYLCVIDGDGQFPLESIATCFAEIKSGGRGLVKTYRSTRNDGVYRRLISKVYNQLFAIMFPNVKSKDVNSKPKIFSREVFEQLRLSSDDWFIDAEIMINLSRLGIKYHEFPVEFKELNGRASFVKFKAIFEFIKNMIRYRFKKYE